MMLTPMLLLNQLHQTDHNLWALMLMVLQMNMSMVIYILGFIITEYADINTDYTFSIA